MKIRKKNEKKNIENAETRTNYKTIHTKHTKPEQLERKRESKCAEKEDDGHEVNIWNKLLIFAFCWPQFPFILFVMNTRVKGTTLKIVPICMI